MSAIATTHNQRTGTPQISHVSITPNHNENQQDNTTAKGSTVAGGSAKPATMTGPAAEATPSPSNTWGTSPVTAPVQEPELTKIEQGGPPSTRIRIQQPDPTTTTPGRRNNINHRGRGGRGGNHNTNRVRDNNYSNGRSTWKQVNPNNSNRGDNRNAEGSYTQEGGENNNGDWANNSGEWGNNSGEGEWEPSNVGGGDSTRGWNEPNTRNQAPAYRHSSTNQQENSQLPSRGRPIGNNVRFGPQTTTGNMEADIEQIAAAILREDNSNLPSNAAATGQFHQRSRRHRRHRSYSSDSSYSASSASSGNYMPHQYTAQNLPVEGRQRPSPPRDAYGLGHEEHPANQPGGTLYKGHISMGLNLHLLPRQGSEMDGLHFFIVSPLSQAITPKIDMYTYAYQLRDI